MRKKRIIILVSIISFVILASSVTVYFLYRYNVITHRSYTDTDFDIETYHSKMDKDNDGIEDQSDILQNVRAYIATNPKYKSKYYASGYPNDEYGVCTDVVAFGLKDAGYDLMELVDADIRKNPESYNIKKPDKNIDFRRVRNLNVYFAHTAISLTTDLKEIKEWQGGDIVVFEAHVAVISDKRNHKGIPFLIHNASPNQFRYEEDVLERWGKIIGHYRIS